MISIAGVDTLRSRGDRLDYRNCLWTHPANVSACEGLRRIMDASAASSAPAQQARWYRSALAAAAMAIARHISPSLHGPAYGAPMIHNRAPLARLLLLEGESYDEISL